MKMVEAASAAAVEAVEAAAVGPIAAVEAVGEMKRRPAPAARITAATLTHSSSGYCGGRTRKGKAQPGSLVSLTANRHT